MEFDSAVLCHYLLFFCWVLLLNFVTTTVFVYIKIIKRYVQNKKMRSNFRPSKFYFDSQKIGL